MNAATCKHGRLLTFRQALAYLGLDTVEKGDRRLRRLVAAKKIAVHRDGRLGFWSADLDEWIERHRTPAVDEPKSRHLDLPRPTGPIGIEGLMPKKLRLSKAS